MRNFMIKYNAKKLLPNNFYKMPPKEKIVGRPIAHLPEDMLRSMGYRPEGDDGPQPHKYHVACHGSIDTKTNKSLFPFGHSAQIVEVSFTKEMR